MIRTVLILLAHDLAVGFKNKTIYLVAGIPLLVFATLALVDPAGERNVPVNIALVEAEAYPTDVLGSIGQAPDQFAVRRVSDAAQATRLLKAREVDGILMPDGGEASRLVLTVVQQTSIETLAIMQRFSVLQAAAEGHGPGWITAVRSLQTSSVKRQSLPTWVLMMVLLVGFIVLPTQVAEEKEKQLLLGWMQTPVREGEWLAAKLAYGGVLMLASVLALQWMEGEPTCTHRLSYLATLCVGGFCFGAMGICLGLLCRTQASARTLGVLCYLPLLLPAALSDISEKMRSLAPLVPSYHFYEPIRVLLLDDTATGYFPAAWITLAAMGLLACLVSHRLIKIRWLM